MIDYVTDEWRGGGREANRGYEPEKTRGKKNKTC